MLIDDIELLLSQKKLENLKSPFEVIGIHDSLLALIKLYQLIPEIHQSILIF